MNALIRFTACVVGAVLLMPLDSANALNYFFDDFEDGDATDGSPVSWVNRTIDFDYTSAVEDIDHPADGELEYTMTLTSNDDGEHIMGAFPENVSGQDVSIQTQLRILQSRPNDPNYADAGFVARILPHDPNLPTDEYTDVWMYAWKVPSRPFATRTGIDIARWNGPGDGWRVLTGTYLPGLDVTQEDVMLRFDLAGRVVTGRAWLPGEDMPEEPQISYVLGSEWLDTGTVALFSRDYTDPGDTFTSVFRWVEVTPTSPADFNLDLAVDAQDLDIWENRYGSPGHREHGDADDDGFVLGSDYLIWQREYVAGAPGLAAELGVPEPSTLLLGLMSCVALMRRRLN